MKKYLKSIICITAVFLMATSVNAAETLLYALDGREMYVDDSMVGIYTAENMGWYLEKPVTMYSIDGRTLVVPANEVAVYQGVGWYLKENLPLGSGNISTVEPVADKVGVRYTDGTIVTVPAEHLNAYLSLGWEKVESNDNANMVQYMTVYSYDGNTQQIPVDMYETYKASGWYSAYDEAVYAYAAFGNGRDVPGVTKLLENKKYEAAFNLVKDSIDKIENTQSEYVSMLYYLRTSVTDTWREAAKSPLGFLNYWFVDRNGKRYIIFEYRNVSNNRIKSFEINFDICNSYGEVIEKNTATYRVDNLQLIPCDKTRVGWEIESGKDAASITNLKVIQVKFSDGTTWTATK